MSVPSACAAIRFDYRPRVRLIASTRALVTDLCEQLLDDPDATARVAMAAHELMENVAKYSSGGEGSVEVELSQHNGQSYVQVSTKNHASAEQRETLQHVIGELRRTEDPVAYYDAVIAKSARSKGSGLGLARIRAEGNMDLELSIEGDEVTISAQGSVAVRKSP
jgi:anti-sigma regulatory factor (Ser/Thr protein kinase)